MNNISTKNITVIDFESTLDITGEEYIRQMFNATTDNTLYIPKRTTDVSTIDDVVVKYTMTWNQEDTDKIIDMYTGVLNALNAGPEQEMIPYIIAEAVPGFKNTYNDWVTVTRARRYCRLIELKAPKIIIDAEALFLAEAFVINLFSSSMEEFKVEE